MSTGGWQKGVSPQKVVDLLEKHHKIKVPKADIVKIVQKTSGPDELLKALDKKFKEVKAAELKKTLKLAGLPF